MKIPDDVFKNRCPYCMHGMVQNGNKDIPKERMFTVTSIRDRSCRIMGVCHCDKIAGECESFEPSYIFGICMTCEWFNTFHGDTGCTRDESPNRRLVYIVNSYSRPIYQARGFTCDAYEVDRTMIESIKARAAAGKAPQNFDPETMEPIGRLEESKSAAEHWEMLARKAKAEEEAARRAREEKNGQQIEFSLDDFEED